MLYVETLINTDMATLWRRTQNPTDHCRWDARFGRIEPVGDRDFRYSTRVMGISIAGTGTAVGESHRADGSCTSALRFRSAHPLSQIADGAGYWRYVPTPNGVRFLTGYRYTPRYRWADPVFRPLMGWATAWSFDRLRLWLEDGTAPETALRAAVADAAARVAALVAAFWFPPVALLAFLPRSRRTPSARRCLRTPPDRVAATAPSVLAGLS